MVHSGIVIINNVVVSDPRVPIGGVKNSGFGRELSRLGMLESVTIKSVRFYNQLIEHQYSFSVIGIYNMTRECSNQVSNTLLKKENKDLDSHNIK